MTCNQHHEQIQEKTPEKDDDDVKKLSKKNKRKFIISMTIFVILFSIYLYFKKDSFNKFIELTRSSHFYIILMISAMALCIIIAMHKNTQNKKLKKVLFVAGNAFIISFFAYMDIMFPAFWYAFIVYYFYGDF